VGFTKVGDREKLSEGIAAHGWTLSQSGHHGHSDPARKDQTAATALALSQSTGVESDLNALALPQGEVDPKVRTDLMSV
jgi:hypothetical protein